METAIATKIIPDNEADRLRVLSRYHPLYKLPERYFSNLARMIATTFGAPIALVSLVDEEAVLFPGNYGMPGTLHTPRESSLCSIAILDKELTVFENALEDPCLLSNPLVAGEFGLRFYAGAPIVTKDGYAIGTVCIVDKEPRAFGEQEKEMLKEFAWAVMEELESRLELLK